MQEAIPHRNRSWHQSPASTYENNDVLKLTPSESGSKRGEFLKTLLKENAVIVFARRGCCLSYVVRHLLHLLGAKPAVYELDDGDHNLVGELFNCATTLGGGDMQFPAVFIGGRWFGGLDRIIATHITEELAPTLKQAGALWL